MRVIDLTVPISEGMTFGDVFPLALPLKVRGECVAPCNVVAIED